ncbi:Gfo/Idh/MocA family oxidoreductase [Reinekea sp.]|uniref:Gfo/Idh/MocA family protein n=1 Tax=Reinekea sp. TaxID=1970455 RepID=UPI002A7F2C60|nr:Gfo/Idh/MocA family oxidoreductase [Reinekea sp.]
MIRWAVVGTGTMAGLFLQDTAQVTQGRFGAVFSHSMSRAQAFADTHGLARAYDDYDRLLANEQIDAVYIASTHPNHGPQAIAALNAGKHVLVEKPMALSEAEAQAVFDAAARNARFCAEAVWTKFNPVYQSLQRQLAAGRIGTVQHLSASFGFALDMSKPQQRLLDPAQAGGALLDIGLYPIMLALSVMGYPDQTQARVVLGPTGVDIAADLLLSYADGRSANLAYRLDAHLPTKASIGGSLGWVELETPWFSSNALHWSEIGKPVSTEYGMLINRGWGRQFERVNEAIAEGQLEVSEHRWADSVQLARYMESVRTTWGPIYPFER